LIKLDYRSLLLTSLSIGLFLEQKKYIACVLEHFVILVSAWWLDYSRFVRAISI